MAMEELSVHNHVASQMGEPPDRRPADPPHVRDLSDPCLDLLNRAVEMGAGEVIFTPGTHVVMTDSEGRPAVFKKTFLSHEDTLKLAFNVMNHSQREYFKKNNSITFRYPFKKSVYQANLFVSAGIVVAQFTRAGNDSDQVDQLPEALRTMLEGAMNRILVCYGDAGCDRLFRSVIEHYNEGGYHKIAVLTGSAALRIRSKKGRVFVIQKGTDHPCNQSTFEFLSNMRPHVLCLDELLGYYPLDAALGLCNQSRMTVLKVYAANAAEALCRITNEFPFHMARGLRTSLVSNLCAMVGQRTVTTASGQQGYINEVLVNNADLRALLEEGNIFDEPKAGSVQRIMESGKDGMISFNQSIESLVEAGTITTWEGYRRHGDREKFMEKFVGLRTLRDGQ